MGSHIATDSEPNPWNPDPIKLAIAMPVFGNWGDTLDCVNMLARQSSKQFRLYLIDDGSLEPPPLEIDSFNFVRYHRKSHTGFAATCNAAVKMAAKEGSTHILLLNNDTAFEAEFIQAWIDKATQFPEAIMGPMIYHFDHPNTVWYSGGSHSILIPFFRCRQEFTAQQAVDILTGCVLLVPVKIWCYLGGFDESYVTYYEDFDFMLRARDAGVVAYLLVDNELRVWHKISQTSLLSGRWNREYRMLVSRLLFIRKRYMGIEKFFCLAATIPHLLFLALKNLPCLPSRRKLLNAFRQGLQPIQPPCINDFQENIN